MASIEIRNLRKHYKQGTAVVKALDAVSLSIGAGEFVAVVGRSGSGKTTRPGCRPAVRPGHPIEGRAGPY